MPYYCTVPRCTSMAGKAKNVSFHQFPRDEELARLWNDILKRGKPYTKYSKVCSLHFKPEDYTITSVGKNKGQWRTLRKDAVPSQNLPSESPAPYSRKQWESWSQNSCTPNVMDPAIHQHMAQAIYMQTMLAMQAAGTTDSSPHQNGPLIPELPHKSTHEDIKTNEANTDTTSYKCTECTKCFKDPDVFILHKRSHTKDIKNNGEKENFNMNLTLRSNPILANLLKTNNEVNFDPNVVTMENLLMTALAANMDYLRNFSVVKEERDDGNHARIDLHATGDSNHVTSDSNHARSDLYHDRRDSHVMSDSNHATSDLYHPRSDLHVTDDSNHARSDSNADLNRIRSDLNNVGTELHTNLDPPREIRKSNHDKADFSSNKNLGYSLGLKYDQNHQTGDLNHMKPDFNKLEDLNLIKSDIDNLSHQNHLISDLNHSKDDLNHSKGDLDHLKSDLNHQKGDSNHQSSMSISFAMNFSTKVEPNSLKYNGYYRERCFTSEYEKENDSSDSDSEKNNDFKRDSVSHCDNDLNESLDSNSLVIDESI